MDDTCFLKFNDDYVALRYLASFLKELKEKKKQIVVSENKLQVSAPPRDHKS